jgi:hypothetical protein
MNRSRYTPRVELLEDRTVPATLRLIAGHAFISNPSTSTLTLTATGTNTFNLMDGTLNVNFNVGGTLFIKGSNKADTISIDMAGNTFTGNLLIDSGNGNDVLDVFSSVDGGEIRGLVTSLSGRGGDTLGLNSAGTGAMTFRGRIQALDTLGTDTVTVGNATGATSLLGDVLLTGFNDVNVGQGAADIYGRDLHVRVIQEATGIDVLVNANVTVSRDLNVFGTPVGDVVNLLGPADIGRNVNISLSHGSDTITVSDAAGGGAPITVNGDFNLDMGEGDNSYDLDDPFNVFGNFTLRAGHGTNLVNNYNGSTGGDLRVFFGNGINNLNLATTGLTIGGNVLVVAGNGDNAIGFADVVVGGDVDLRLGNGNNVVTAIDPATFGGTFNLRTGNGNNQLAFIYSTPILVKVNVHFGNGDDSVLVSGTTITGLIDGGGGTNTFTEGLPNTYVPPFTLVNF